MEDTTRQLKWIEGVGSINFCTPWFPFCYHTGWNHSRGNLLCYHLDDTLLYQNEDYESCFYTTLSTKENNSEFEVSIYPNPSSGPFFIQFYQPTRQEGEVLLYDVNGGLLSQHRFEKGASKIEFSEQQNASLKQILVVIVMNNRPIQIQKLLLRS